MYIAEPPVLSPAISFIAAIAMFTKTAAYTTFLEDESCGAAFRIVRAPLERLKRLAKVRDWTLPDPTLGKVTSVTFTGNCHENILAAGELTCDARMRLQFCVYLSHFRLCTDPRHNRLRPTKALVRSFPARLLSIPLAHTMSLKGSVRMDAIVAPNGTVRSVVLRGGHPVLARAAQSAIMKLRWEPTAHETREPIEVKFDPQ